MNKNLIEICRIAVETMQGLKMYFFQGFAYSRAILKHFTGGVLLGSFFYAQKKLGKQFRFDHLKI